MAVTITTYQEVEVEKDVDVYVDLDGLEPTYSYELDSAGDIEVSIEFPSAEQCKDWHNVDLLEHFTEEELLDNVNDDEIIKRAAKIVGIEEE